MLEAEAHWLAQRLAAIPDAELGTVLNVGSSTLSFRTEVQPFIDAQVFAPLRARGAGVVHLDIRADAGVDLVGDLSNPADGPALRAAISARGVRTLVCSNLLEHVVDRAAFCQQIEELLPAGGRLLLTVPHGYPHHPDPIDTGYRPLPADIGAAFPGLKVEHSELLSCGGLWHNRKQLALGKKVLWVGLPFYKPQLWRANLSFFRYINEPFTATCAVLRRG
jgi:hypothetical protein